MSHPTLSFRQWFLEFGEQDMPWVTEMLDGPRGLWNMFQELTRTVQQDQTVWQHFRNIQGIIANIKSAAGRGSEVSVLEQLDKLKTAFHNVYNDLSDRKARGNSPYTNPAATEAVLRRIMSLLDTVFRTQTASPADSGSFAAIGHNPTPRQQVSPTVRTNPMPMRRAV